MGPPNISHQREESDRYVGGLTKNTQTVFLVINVTVRFLSLQAIFELSRGEQDLIEDLKLARKVCPFHIFLVRTFKANRPNKFLAVLSESDALARFLPPFIAKNVSPCKIGSCYYLLILCV